MSKTNPDPPEVPPLVRNFMSTVPAKSKYVCPDYKIDPDEARAVAAYITDLESKLAERRLSDEQIERISVCHFSEGYDQQKCNLAIRAALKLAGKG